MKWKKHSKTTEIQDEFEGQDDKILFYLCTRKIGYGNWQYLEGGKLAFHLTEPNFMAEM